MSDNRNNGAKTTDTRFKPGNPGRPKGSRHRSTVLAEKLMSDDVEGIVAAVVKAAKDGDMTAAKIVLDRLAPVRRGRPVQFDLPGGSDATGVSTAYDTVLQAMAAGEITPEESVSIASVLESRRKAIETAELANRVAELERRTSR